MILVTDANIWIQLEDGDLLVAVFELGLELAAPDQIVRELGPALGPRVCELGVRLLPTVDALDAPWQDLRARYPRPGDVDLYGLLHARLLAARLVTGDRHLREAAEQEGVAVSGLLWLLDLMVEAQCITPQTARRSLQAIRDRGARLPDEDCARRMREWR